MPGLSVAILQEAVQELVVGDGSCVKTTQGPLINAGAVNKVHELVNWAYLLIRIQS